MNGTILISDLETTHRDVDKAGACQVAAVMLSGDAEGLPVMQPLFQTYAVPSEHMSPEALKVHGITPDKYQYAPSDVMAIWMLRQLVEILPKPVVLSGYNCTRYDYQLMDKILPGAGFSTMPQIDVMTLMMRIAPEHGLKLTEVFTRLYPQDPLVQTAHDAMADCWMTARVLMDFMKIYQTYDPISLANYCKTPVPCTIMPYGKYKSRPFEDVPISYLQWMVNKWEDMHPDLAAAMQTRGLRPKTM